MPLKRAFLQGLDLSGVNAFFRAANRGRVKTLLYHNVLDDTGAFSNAISPEEFERHLVDLKTRCNLIKIDQSGDLIGLRDDRVNALLTFDDGFLNNYEVVFPLLVKHGLGACFFVIVDCLQTGAVPAIAERYAKGHAPSREYATINLEQAREMARGGMTIASHSLQHDDFSAESFEAGVADARRARVKLADMLGLEVGLFAYPWGYSLDGQSEALAGDYKRIFTTRHGFNSADDIVFHRNEVAYQSHLHAAAAGSLDFFAPVWRANATFWRDPAMSKSHKAPSTGARPRPKVLCLIETLQRGGGAEQLLVGLAPELRRLGYDIEIATMFDSPDDLAADLEARGVRTHRLGLKYANRWSFLGNVMALRALAASGGFSLFWGHLYFGNLYASLLAQTLAEAKCVVTLHSEGYSQEPPREFKPAVYLTLERALLGRAHAKVAVSEAVGRDYGAFFGWPKVDVIHNGVVLSETPEDLPAGRRDEARARLGAKPGDFLIIVPSRFVAKKGHAVLIEALARLKRDRDWTPRVLAYGQGPLLGGLRAEVARNGLDERFVFTPPVPHSELFVAMQAADAVCMPSLREPFGIAAAEAMALGAPTILTQTDGFLELVGDSQGAMLLPAGDPAGLADAIWTLHQNPGLGREMARRGQARVQATFDIRFCAEKWVALLDRVALGAS